jgi:hypothetical protein
MLVMLMVVLMMVMSMLLMVHAICEKLTMRAASVDADAANGANGADAVDGLRRCILPSDLARTPLALPN